MLVKCTYIFHVNDAVYSFIQQPELLKLKEEVSRIRAKIKSSKKEKEKKEDEKRKHEKEVRKLKALLDEVNREIHQLTEQGQDGVGKLQLADSQLMEYHRM